MYITASSCRYYGVRIRTHDLPHLMQALLWFPFQTKEVIYFKTNYFKCFNIADILNIFSVINFTVFLHCRARKESHASEKESGDPTRGITV